MIGDWSLALIVHPADLRRRKVKPVLGVPGTQLFRHDLFPAETLEKGVILPRAGHGDGSLYPGGEALALDTSYSKFTAADPPLT